MALKIVYNDICRERTDVLVTPASRFPRVGTGLDRAVHETAGERLLEAREKLGNIGPGTLGVSPAFGLREKTGAKYVIHALGPIWSARAGIREELILGGCYFRIFLKAVELGCKTVTVPILSSGRFGMPMGNALKVAVESAETFLLAFPGMTVKLVGIDSDFCAVGSGSDRTSKDKIFALAVALGLSVRYAEALLASCGYKFEPCPREETICGLIENGCQDVLEVNMKLGDLHLPLLDVRGEERPRRK